MYRDITNVDAGTCAVIIDDNTLATFVPNQYNLYKLISNKYYLSSIDTSIDGGAPVDTVCYTSAEINTLPSKFDFITPVYHLMAIISVVLIFYFAYKLILFPFWRKQL